MKNTLIILGMGLLLISCDKDKYNVGVFPQEPVNLKEANSSSDDINSDVPFISEDVHLVFSTNRASTQTGDFNLSLSYLNFSWDKSDGILTVQPSNILFDQDYESFRSWV